MNSNDLRRAFTDYFVARGHTPVPSASLIPADSTLLFTVAGMVPFKPYFLGEEPAPFPRATSIQKCVRAGGKHNDLDQIGRTRRHLTFFEMLGNFSFGDYFKELAIPYAWGLVTDVLGLDPERLWITVHLSDDEAAMLWQESVGVPAERIQRLDEDNWWQMGETGPCGPCSEIYFDKGERYGDAGGPAHGDDERYLEIWNLVFMQYDRQPDGSLVPLPRPCIDTGAGLERIIPVLQGQPSVYETDVVAPILEEAQSLTGRVYGRDEESDVGLRIVSDHARSMTFLLADGVVPTNEGRGYVLRRIMRRLMLRAHLLGASGHITSRLVTRVVETMGAAYPELVERERLVVDLAAREEERFFATLELGLPLLEDAIREGAVRGETAFRLHDTFGVPIELTTELAADRGVSVDLGGFQEAMADQRRRSRAAGLGLDDQARGSEAALRVLDAHGKTEFVGYETVRVEATVLAVEEEGGRRTAYLDCTPFYAEGGGQVGDTGWLRAPGVEVAVLDTDEPVSGVIRHFIETTTGTLVPGMTVAAEVDEPRRLAIRANHSATHLLQWALRRVLGEHVAQQGSLVAPDRLRFDFTHWQALTTAERDEVERLVNQEITRNEQVWVELTPREQALASGAIAFFGEQYREVVRVVHAGSSSVELCGGTHVDRLGEIGMCKIVSESSIGANTRRIEAVTRAQALAYVHELEHLLDELEAQLPGGREQLLGRLEHVLRRSKELEASLGVLRQRYARAIAEELVATRTGPWLAEELPGLDASELRAVAQTLRRHFDKVVLASRGEDRVALVATVSPASDEPAFELLRPVAEAVGGKVGPQAELAVSGGRHVDALDPALEELRRRLGR